MTAHLVAPPLLRLSVPGRDAAGMDLDADAQAGEAIALNGGYPD
jgi:hypothetical protein